MLFKTLFCLILFFNLKTETKTIFHFSSVKNTASWQVVDDVVMGGISLGTISLNTEENAVFKGTVSVENNGGFSSVRHRFKKIDISGYKTICFRVKGAGSKYQFRIKDKATNYYSYIAYFTTNNEWQTIEIPLSEMYPTFRGKILNMPNFDENSVEEIAFLIGNKRSQRFQLEVDKVYLQK